MGKFYMIQGFKPNGAPIGYSHLTIMAYSSYQVAFSIAKKLNASKNNDLIYLVEIVAIR